MNTNKRCTKCGNEKPVSEFRKDKSRKDGLYPYCKQCHNLDSKKYRKENPEKRHETQKKYAAKNKEKISEMNRLWFSKNIEKAKGYFTKWRQNNKSAAIESNRKWREENKEKVSENNKKWSKEHPENRRLIIHKRRALIKGSGGVITVHEMKMLYEHYENTCLCCGKKEPEIKITLDHVIPISKGGSNTIENAQPLCLSCNSKKGVKIIDYRIKADGTICVPKFSVMETQ